MSAPYNPEIITCCGALQSLLLDHRQSSGRLTKPALTRLRRMYSTFSVYSPMVQAAVGRPFGASGLDTARRRKAKANACGALPWSRLWGMVRPLGLRLPSPPGPAHSDRETSIIENKDAGVSKPR